MKILFLFILLAAAAQIMAQTDSIPIGRVTYQNQCLLSRDPNDVYINGMENGISTLLFNPANTLLIHNGISENDSIGIADYTKSNISKKGLGYPIYRKTGDRNIYFRQFNNSLYRDSVENIDWTLFSDQRELGGYICLKAIGWFRGREYEAWYCPDIPIHSGPYKLWGLPGLILEASTTDGKVSFLFRGLELSDHIRGAIVIPIGELQEGSYYERLRRNREKLEENIRATNAQMVAEGSELVFTASFNSDNSIEIFEFK